MAIHNFNYTYQYISCKTMPVSIEDETQIVRHITINVTAIDQADTSQTLSQDMSVSLDGVYAYKSDGLPNDFIAFNDLTDEKIINWYKSTTQTNDLDIYFTWQIYGVDEVDPIVEDGE